MMIRLCSLIIVVAAGLISCGTKTDPKFVETRKNLAGELRDNKLYSAAIEEYRKILDEPSLVTGERANINYLIARIYFEDLQNFEQAAAYYLRAKTLNPEATFEAEASRNLVTSLEKMGRVIDAKRQLNEMTEVNNTPPSKGDVPVAKIDGQPIWLSEVERQIQTLPPEVQKQFEDVSAKRDFARQYVGTELMYRAAIREDMENDPEIKKREEALHRSMLIEKYLLEKVIPQVRIDSLDVLNFYKANKSRYDDKPFDSVKARVFMDYQNEKTQSAYSDYISKLAAVEKVEFLEHNIK